MYILRMIAVEQENMQCEAQQACPPRNWNIVVCTWSKSDRMRPSYGRINPYLDPGVCRIAPKMLRIHYLVGVSHFAESWKSAGDWLHEKC